MVDFDHKTILLGTMIPISLYSFAKIFNLWRYTQYYVRKIQNEPIYNLDELIRIRSSGTIPKHYYKLVKVVVDNPKTYIRKQAATLNYYMYAWPSRKDLAGSFVFNANVNEMKWTVKDMESRRTCTVKGLGAVMDPVIDVKVDFKDSNRYMSSVYRIWTIIWGSLAFTTEFLISLITLPFHGFKKSSVLFEGPEIGEFYIVMKITPNMGLLLLAKFEDGMLVPEAIANSRYRILDYLRLYYNFFAFMAIAAAVTTSVLLLYFYKSFTRKVKPQHEGMKYLELKDCPYENTCVICMNNCRNIIFYDCLHMSVCHYCFATLENKKCPVCKAAIVESKNVYQKKYIV